MQSVCMHLQGGQKSRMLGCKGRQSSSAVQHGSHGVSISKQPGTSLAVQLEQDLRMLLTQRKPQLLQSVLDLQTMWQAQTYL